MPCQPAEEGTSRIGSDRIESNRCKGMEQRHVFARRKRLGRRRVRLERADEMTQRNKLTLHNSQEKYPTDVTKRRNDKKKKMENHEKKSTSDKTEKFGLYGAGGRRKSG